MALPYPQGASLLLEPTGRAGQEESRRPSACGLVEAETTSTSPPPTPAARRVAHVEQKGLRTALPGSWPQGGGTGERRSVDFAQYLHSLSFSEAIENLRADGQISTQVVWHPGHRGLQDSHHLESGRERL